MRAFFSASAAACACACFLASSASASAICCLTSFAEGTNSSGLFVMLSSNVSRSRRASYPSEGGDLAWVFLCVGFGSGFCDPEPGHIQRGQADQGQNGCYGE